jgi:hypothetical protein
MSCNTDEIHVGDIGTTFKCLIKDDDVVRDVSGATTKELIFSKPSGETMTKTATFTTDGTDGYIEYSTITDDLDESGYWKLQGHIVLPGLDLRTNIVTFKVYPNL